MAFQVLLGFHIIGAVLWIGGLMVVSGLIRYFEKTDGAKSGPSYKGLTKKYLNVMVMPGLIVSSATGLLQLLSNGFAFYMTQGWFHGKLTAAILLYVISVVVWRSVENVQNDRPVNGGRMGMIHGFIGAVFLILVLTTYIGRV